MFSNTSSSSDSGAWSIDSNGFAEAEPKGAVESSQTFCTVIGPQCRMGGTFEFSGGAQIDGVLEGEITAEGELIIGETAQIKATIRGERVGVFGRVIGDIYCNDRLEIFSGARVSGNISSPRLVIHDGVVFDGSCCMDPEAAGGSKKRMMQGNEISDSSGVIDDSIVD